MAKDTWFIDWEKKRINRYATEYEELAQTIQRALMTDRFYYPIYTWQYGSELKDLIGTKTIKYIEGAVLKDVKDALAFETRVLNIDSVTVKYQDDHSYLITVEVSTTLGVVRKELRYDVQA